MRFSARPGRADRAGALALQNCFPRRSGSASQYRNIGPTWTNYNFAPGWYQTLSLAARGALPQQFVDEHIGNRHAPLRSAAVYGSEPVRMVPFGEIAADALEID